MPTYDYQCDTCNHAWEEFQSMSSSPTTECPSCHKPSARRLIGVGAGLIFKGSGFYTTDYRKSGARSSSSESASSSESSSSNTGPT